MHQRRAGEDEANWEILRVMDQINYIQDAVQGSSEEDVTVGSMDERLYEGLF